MSEGDKYTCPLCVRALQQQERREQRKAEAAAAAEIEREAKEAQAARKAKLVCMLCPTHKQRKRLDCITTLCTHGRICAYITQKHIRFVGDAGRYKALLVANSNTANTMLNSRH